LDSSERNHSILYVKRKYGYYTGVILKTVGDKKIEHSVKRRMRLADNIKAA
jgi:hypothetical protein